MGHETRQAAAPGSAGLWPVCPGFMHALGAHKTRSSCAPSRGHVHGVMSIHTPPLDQSSSLATVRSLQEAPPATCQLQQRGESKVDSPLIAGLRVDPFSDLATLTGPFPGLLRGRQMPSSAIMGWKSEFAEWVELRLGPWRSLLRSPRSSRLLVPWQTVLAIREHPLEHSEAAPLVSACQHGTLSGKLECRL